MMDECIALFADAVVADVVAAVDCNTAVKSAVDEGTDHSVDAADGDRHYHCYFRPIVEFLLGVAAAEAIAAGAAELTSAVKGATSTTVALVAIHPNRTRRCDSCVSHGACASSANLCCPSS